MIMDNIATQLTQLQTIKQDIATAIEGKGGTVGEGFDTYATAISNIPSGGGGTPQIRLSENPDLRFGYSKFSSLPNWLIVDTVYDNLFYMCYNLEGSINLPNTLTNIPDSTFYYCNLLNNIHLPTSLTWISNNAFYCCYLLHFDSSTSLILPSSLEYIGDSAFYSCHSLTSVTIPNSVTKIESNTFYDCRELTSVSIPRNAYLFGNIDYDGTNTLTSSCFAYCTGLTSVTIPGEIKMPGYNMFEGCGNLTSVTIEEGIELLPDYIFSNCSSLTSVTIPSTVEYLHDNVFNYCQALEWIKCLPLTPPEHYEEHLWGHGPIFPFEDTNDCPIYVPDAALSAYTSSSIWENYWSRLKPMSDFATDFPNA